MPKIAKHNVTIRKGEGLLALLLVTGGVACSAGHEERPVTDSSQPIRTTEQAPDKPGANAVDDVAVLVVERHDGALTVKSATARPAKAFGKGVFARGHGHYIVQWTHKSSKGAELAKGELALAGDVRVPPDPNTGAPGAHVAVAPETFTIRVPWPQKGETIELVTQDGSAKGVWP